MRITSWNLLHGMAIPPAGSSELNAAISELDSDIFAFQEVDHFLERTNSLPQIRDAAEYIQARDWAFAPSVIGTPGVKWRKLRDGEPEIICATSRHSDFIHESYGIGIISKIPVREWRRINLGNAPIGMPLIVPGDESGKGRPRFIYVADEPRLALAAILENGWTVINTHLSFVPGVNLRQLKRIKNWAQTLAAETSTKVLIVGDMNLPNGLPELASKWRSLVKENTYPSWGAKIQFDYILSNNLLESQYTVRTFAKTGISDHLPIGIEISQ